MRSKMRTSQAANSSIYWDSVDSSGSGSSASGSRNYVDPWDLENYAYLRRHSVAAPAPVPTPQPIYQTSRRPSRAAYHHQLSSPIEPDYWYAPSATREPGYDAPASVEEIYFRPPRPISTGCYYHQPIYEDESTASMSHYAAPVPLYAHLSEIEQAEALEELRTREMLRRQSKAARARNYPREKCLYHSRPSEMLFAAATLRRSRQHVEELEESVDEVDNVTTRYRESIKPTHIMLNTHGHLKIDYTNSWNSLHRKIASK